MADESPEHGKSGKLEHKGYKDGDVSVNVGQFDSVF